MHRPSFFCVVCEEVLATEDGIQHYLPCLHSVCAFCFKELLQDAHEKGKPLVCLVCMDKFALEDVVTSSVPVVAMCSVHPTNDLCQLCCQCQAFICSVCLESSHQMHNCLSFTAGDQFKDGVLAEVSKLAHRLPQQESMLAELRGMQGALLQRMSALVVEITSIFDSVIEGEKLTKSLSESHLQKLIAALEQRRDSLVVYIQTQLKSQIKIVEMQCQALKLLKEQINVVQTEALSINQPTTSLHSIYQCKLIFIRAKQLQSTEIATDCVLKGTWWFRFENPDKLNAFTAKTLGTVYRAPRNFCLIKNPILRIGDYGRTELGKFQSMRGVGILPNNHLVVSDSSNRRLQILSPDGVFIQQISLPPFPQHIAVAPSGEIWSVMCYGVQKQLLSYSANGDQIGMLAVPNTSCFDDITFYSDDIIIGACGADGSVKAFDRFGSILWEVGDFPEVCAITVAHTTGEVFVCDYSKNRIIVLSAVDGQFIRFLGERRIQGPRGICVAPNSDCIVIAEDRSFSIWTFAGQFVHDSGPVENSFSSPYGVAVFEDGRIAVTDEVDNCLRIF